MSNLQVLEKISKPDFLWTIDESGHWPPIDGVPAIISSWETVTAHFRQHGFTASAKLSDLASPGAWVSDVLVDEHLRGRGVGRLLIEEIIRRCQRLGKEAVSLSCVIENVPALTLYRSLGFLVASYGVDDSRYLMVKPLLLNCVE